MSISLDDPRRESWPYRQGRADFHSGSVHVPLGGMRDCEVLTTERRTVETNYELKRIEPPTYAAPAHLARTQSDDLSVARATLRDEIEF